MAKVTLKESEINGLVTNVVKRMLKEAYEKEMLLAFVQWLPKQLGFNLIEELRAFGKHYGQDNADMISNIIANIDDYPEYKDYLERLMSKKYKKNRVIREKRLGKNFDIWADIETSGEHTKGIKKDKINKEKAGNKNAEYKHNMNHAKGRSGIDEAVEGEKRYVAVIDFYIYANSDEEAKKKAQTMCTQIDDGENECSVIKLAEQPTGSLDNRVIYGE